MASLSSTLKKIKSYITPGKEKTASSILGGAGYSTSGSSKSSSSSKIQGGMQTSVATGNTYTPVPTPTKIGLDPNAPSPSTISTSQLNAFLNAYNASNAPVQGSNIKSTISSGAYKSSNGNITIGLDPNAPSPSYLDKASAPSKVSSINTVSSPNGISNVSMGIGNVAPAQAMVAGQNAGIDQSILGDQRYAELLKAQQEAQAKTEKDTSVLEKLFKKAPDITKTREDAFAQTGIVPADYFADQKARIMEIDSLTQDYNATVAAKDAQIAQSYDKLASMNFINNQIAQINRNAEPLLRQKSANINSKAATMQALQGNFAEAQKFVNQAVDDVVASYKLKVDSATAIYEVHKDALNSIDSKYKDALNNAIDLYKFNYSKAYDEAQKVGELQVYNPNAGIDVSKDTLQEAYAKVFRTGGSTQYKLDVAQEARLAAEQKRAEGDISPADYTKGLNYILLNGSADDVAKFKEDRAFQAWVLSKI